METDSLNNKLSKKPAGASDHLANERTFLAWIRTSIAMMGFGFVIVKFALFIRQITAVLHQPNINPNQGFSAVIGVIMVAFGALIAALSFVRYRNVEKQLNNGSYFSSQWLSIVVTVSIIIGSILLVLYLLPNI
ncbi:MAG: DUF202 domain-containing protein [Bacteroidota bacterium]|nr:DUF202 domain-containing protein [Bacteroidota bacterium]